MGCARRSPWQTGSTVRCPLLARMSRRAPRSPDQHPPRRSATDFTLISKSDSQVWLSVRQWPSKTGKYTCLFCLLCRQFRSVLVLYMYFNVFTHNHTYKIHFIFLLLSTSVWHGSATTTRPGSSTTRAARGAGDVAIQSTAGRETTMRGRSTTSRKPILARASSTPIDVQRRQVWVKAIRLRWLGTRCPARHLRKVHIPVHFVRRGMMSKCDQTCIARAHSRACSFCRFESTGRTIRLLVRRLLGTNLP